MAKTVGFVLLNEFAEWENAYLASALSLIGNGAFVNKFLTIDAKEVESVANLKVEADGDLTATADCDAIVLVGSMSWKTEQSEKAAPYVEAFCRTGKPLGAIGNAVSVLATLGCLNDKSHTGNSKKELMSWAGASYTGQDRFQEQAAVRDGNLVTANATGCLEFAREMLTVLGLDQKEIEEWYLYYKQGMYSSDRN